MRTVTICRVHTAELYHSDHGFPMIPSPKFRLQASLTTYCFHCGAELGQVGDQLQDHALCSHYLWQLRISFRWCQHNDSTMESCYSVEKELEKLLSKFSYIDKHTANSLQELLTYVDGVKRELIEGQLFSLQHNHNGPCWRSPYNIKVSIFDFCQ